MGVKIKKIETYLPPHRVTNKQLAIEFQNWDAEKIENKTGVQERRIIDEHQTALDLAFVSAKEVLNHYDPKKIDFLLYCTQSPEYYLPSGACILQDQLGLRTNIGAFDFNLGCSGYIYGLAMAKSLINTHLANTVLLITAETYTKHIHPLDKTNRTIFGDGAAATIIEKSDEEHILEFSLGTDGSGYQNLIVPNGGMRKRYDPTAPEKQDRRGSIRTDNHLFMNGKQIFNFTIDAVPQVVDDVLSKNNFTMGEIDYVIFHQANRYMLEHLREKIEIPQEKFYINLTYTGNTVCATIPIALKDCLDQNIIKTGDRVLLVGFGVGYSWGGTVILIP